MQHKKVSNYDSSIGNFNFRHSNHFLTKYQILHWAFDRMTVKQNGWWRATVPAVAEFRILNFISVCLSLAQLVFHTRDSWFTCIYFAFEQKAEHHLSVACHWSHLPFTVTLCFPQLFFRLSVWQNTFSKKWTSFKLQIQILLISLCSENVFKILPLNVQMYIFKLMK